MQGSKQIVLRWIITVIIFMAFGLQAPISRAYEDEWTWVSGSDTVLQAGTYGEKGTPAAANVPGARYGSAVWTDSTGDLWLFGGWGQDTTEIRHYLNDLWRYDIADNVWTWISGSDTVGQAGTYGEKGTPAATNVPGARYGSAVWTHSTGDLWLFGGYGVDNTGEEEYLNDLWRYDIADNVWTWIGGSDTVDQAGIYGEKGTPAADNIPGSRYESVAWADNSTGDLWLFGGFGLDIKGDDRKNRQRYMNDLWCYNLDNNTWTWVSGSDEVGQHGYYGDKGTPSEDNRPGARYESVAWMDNSAGYLWLFGGYGLNNNGSQYYLNDLWRYDIDNDMWTWMSGSEKVGKSGKYGAKGMSAEDNVPGARWDSTSWVDSTGNLWLFGGYGHADSGVDFLNDLWRYDTDNDMWTWMSGSDEILEAGTYGEKGTPAGDNVPGARDGSVAWMDNTGNLWLFGGYGLDSTRIKNRKRTKHYLNDLWSYHVPPNIDMNITVDTCSITAGKSDNTDSIKFSGWMDAGDAYMSAGDEIIISLWTEQVPDPDAVTFSFPINAETYINGKYKSLKDTSADKSDPVLSFVYDSAKSTMTFSAKNVDLTGLRCPIILTIQIGDYIVEEKLDEDIVNGPEKPCPLQLVMGVWDSLDVEKFKAKKGKNADTDSFSISGTFTVDGPFDEIQLVDIMLGPDTFSVPGEAFALKNDSFSCKKVDVLNGFVTAEFDTAKCTYSIEVTKTTLSGSGDVAFSLDVFGNLLQAPDPVTLPEEF